MKALGRIEKLEARRLAEIDGAWQSYFDSLSDLFQWMRDHAAADNLQALRDGWKQDDWNAIASAIDAEQERIPKEINDRLTLTADIVKAHRRRAPHLFTAWHASRA